MKIPGIMETLARMQAKVDEMRAESIVAQQNDMIIQREVADMRATAIEQKLDERRKVTELNEELWDSESRARESIDKHDAR
jgi:hypothetical protein